MHNLLNEDFWKSSIPILSLEESELIKYLTQMMEAVVNEIESTGATFSEILLALSFVAANKKLDYAKGYNGTTHYLECASLAAHEVNMSLKEPQTVVEFREDLSFVATVFKILIEKIAYKAREISIEIDEEEMKAVQTAVNSYLNAIELQIK